MLLTLGLSYQSYLLCLVGRLIFGISDSVTIFQHTILCFWFDTNRLPFVFGIMLFFVKGIRATNDNLAPIFYNATGSIPAYFWLGFFICLGSLTCCYFLITLHVSIFDPAKHHKPAIHASENNSNSSEGAVKSPRK